MVERALINSNDNDDDKDIAIFHLCVCFGGSIVISSLFINAIFIHNECND